MLSQIKASEKYDKANTTRLYIKLNNHHDKDIIDKLDTVPNKQGYVKSLIRKDIKEGVAHGETETDDSNTDDG